MVALNLRDQRVLAKFAAFIRKQEERSLTNKINYQKKVEYKRELMVFEKSKEERIKEYQKEG